MLQSNRWAIAGVLALGAVLAGWAVAASRHSHRRPTPPAADNVATNPPTDVGWPNLFGPQHNSVSTEREINPAWPEAGPPVVWRARIGEGYSSPVADGDDVVVFHRPVNDPSVAVSVDLHPGEATHGPDEVITCFDAATGRLRWEFRHPTSFRCSTHYSSGPYSTPILSGEHVYACGTEGNLYCLNRMDGALLWQRELWTDYGLKQHGHFPVTGSPLLWKDRLILNLGASDTGAGIIAIDAATGATLWQATDHKASYATPCAATIHGLDFVFVFTESGLVAINPTSGNEYWQVKFRANNPEFVNATSPIVYRDIVFTSGHAVGNLCLQILPNGSYKELWRDRRRNFDSQYNPLACIDGSVYGFAALDDTFRCIDLLTGEVRWKGLREIDRGAMIAADGHFLILGTQGHLASVRIDAGKLQVVSQTKQPVISGPAYSLPALHRGLLYLRNQRELVALDLRK